MVSSQEEFHFPATATKVPRGGYMVPALSPSDFETSVLCVRVIPSVACKSEPREIGSGKSPRCIFSDHAPHSIRPGCTQQSRMCYARL